MILIKIFSLQTKIVVSTLIQEKTGSYTEFIYARWELDDLQEINSF